MPSNLFKFELLLWPGSGMLQIDEIEKIPLVASI